MFHWWGCDEETHTPQVPAWGTTLPWAPKVQVASGCHLGTAAWHGGLLPLDRPEAQWGHLKASLSQNPQLWLPNLPPRPRTASRGLSSLPGNRPRQGEGRSDTRWAPAWKFFPFYLRLSNLFGVFLIHHHPERRLQLKRQAGLGGCHLSQAPSWGRCGTQGPSHPQTGPAVLGARGRFSQAPACPPCLRGGVLRSWGCRARWPAPGAPCSEAGRLLLPWENVPGANRFSRSEHPEPPEATVDRAAPPRAPQEPHSARLARRQCLQSETSPGS